MSNMIAIPSTSAVRNNTPILLRYMCEGILDEIVIPRRISTEMSSTRLLKRLLVMNKIKEEVKEDPYSNFDFNNPLKYITKPMPQDLFDELQRCRKNWFDSVFNTRWGRFTINSAYGVVDLPYRISCNLSLPMVGKYDELLEPKKITHSYKKPVKLDLSSMYDQLGTCDNIGIIERNLNHIYGVLGDEKDPYIKQQHEKGKYGF